MTAEYELPNLSQNLLVSLKLLDEWPSFTGFDVGGTPVKTDFIFNNLSQYDILVLIANMQRLIINAHDDMSILGLSLHLRPYFLYACEECSGSVVDS